MKKLLSILIIMAVLLTACTPTKTINIENGATLMVAHRGLSGLEVENTTQAFTLACNHTYYGVESDVRKTSDGKFVIVHDDNLERISGRNVQVETSTLSELREVPLLNKSNKVDGTYRVATLQEYISICKEYQKACVLELKSYFSQSEIQQIIDIIAGYDYLSSVTFISFYYDNLIKVRNVLPSQPAQFLFSDVTDEIIYNLKRDNIGADVNHTHLSKEIVKRFHDNGIYVNCWTVDSKSRAETLISWGVDFITTNILE